MSAKTVRVAVPGKTEVLNTQLYFPYRGKYIGYAVRHENRTVEVPAAQNVFLDASSDILDSPVTYQTAKGVFHQNPVYHHKINLGGSVILSFSNNLTVWDDVTLDFGREVRSYPGLLDPTKPDYGTQGVFTCALGFPSFKAYDYGSVRDVHVQTVVVILECGVYYKPQVEEYQINSFNLGFSVIGKSDAGYSTCTQLRNPDFRILPDNSVLVNHFNQELLSTGFRGMDALYESIRAYARTHIAAGPQPTGWPVTYHDHMEVTDLPDDQDIIRWLQGVLPKFTVSDYHSFHGEIPWSELAAYAYQNIGYADNNGIAYLKEATELKDTTIQYLNTLRSVKSSRGAKRAKALAAAYLGVHYGYKLTLLDTADYIKSLRKNRYKDRIQRCASTHNTVLADNWHVTARYQVFYRTKDWGNPQSELVNEFLQQVDLLPTPENLWDMVPYSFVVDWFANIGKTLTSIGNLGILQNYYKVLCRTQSTRATRDLSLATSPSDQIGYSGAATEVIYERTVSPYPLAPNPYSQLQPASPLNHFVEGAALVVQQL